MLSTNLPNGFYQLLPLADEKSGDWSIVKRQLSDADKLRLKLTKPTEYNDSYTLLLHRDTVVMSDIVTEYWEHQDALLASGKVLIAGLGLGIVLHALSQKSDVNEIVVVELNQDVIDLTWKYYKDLPNVTLVKQNIFEFEFDESFDYAWFDIWSNISVDNISEMTSLLDKCKPNGISANCWGYRETLRRLGRLDEVAELEKQLSDNTEQFYSVTYNRIINKG